MDCSYGSDPRIHEKILEGRNHFTNAANYIAPIRKAKWMV